MLIGNLPYTLGFLAAGSGRSNLTGKQLLVFSDTGATTLYTSYYDSTYPGADGALLRGTITYTV